MISSISQISQKQYNKKQITKPTFKENSLLLEEGTDVFQKDGNHAVTKEELAQDFQKRVLLAMFVSLATLPLVLYFMTAIKKGNFKLFSKGDSFKFQSLESDKRVPKLDDCKSINKDLKNLLQRQIKMANASPEIIEEIGYPRNTNRILLSGPPGAGKTFFAKIYAKTLGAEHLEILYSDINSRWVGESEDKLTSIFENAMKQAKKNPKKKYVLVFNEIDSLVTPIEQLTGGGGSTHFVSLRRQRSIFLTYLEKLQEKTPNITIIGTTNMPIKSKNLDGASMSRFENILEIPYPDEGSLFEALKLEFTKLKNKEEFFAENEENLKNLAKTMSERKFSFRNLENLVNEAKTTYLIEKTDNKSAQFKFEYLNDALKLIQKSDGEKEFENIAKNIAQQAK